MAFVWTYVVHILYFPTMSLVKSSVLIFLLRLGGHTRQLRVVIHSLNVVNLAFMVAVLFGSVAQCSPIPFMWDKTIPGGTCFNQAAFYLIQTGLNLLTDSFTLGLPIWVFRYSTKMGRRMKLATLYVFLLGFM
jgi:hypothetical protein